MQRAIKNNTYCCVPQCTSHGTINPPQSFHKFPCDISHSELIRRQKWIRVLRIGKKVTERMRVCSKHFKSTDFFFPGVPCKKHHLKKNTVPSQCLPVTPTETQDKKKKKVQLAQIREQRYATINDSGARKSWGKCVLCGATRRKHPERKFFRFPKDAERSRLWTSVCVNSGVTNLANESPVILHRQKRICSIHFGDEAFASLKKHFLHSCAIPSVFENVGRTATVDVSSMMHKLATLLAKGNEKEDGSSTSCNQTGKPSDLLEENNPDWAPSLNLGYNNDADSSKTFSRHNRSYSRNTARKSSAITTDTMKDTINSAIQNQRDSDGKCNNRYQPYIDRISVSNYVNCPTSEETPKLIDMNIQTSDETPKLIDMNNQTSDETPKLIDMNIQTSDETLKLIDMNIQTSDETSKLIDMNIQTSEDEVEDKFSLFGDLVANQLRQLPLHRALECQCEIMKILTLHQMEASCSSTEQPDSETSSMSNCKLVCDS